MARARRKAFVSRALCSSVVAPPSRATTPSQSWVTSDSRVIPWWNHKRLLDTRANVSAYDDETGVNPVRRQDFGAFLGLVPPIGDRIVRMPPVHRIYGVKIQQLPLLRVQETNVIASGVPIGNHDPVDRQHLRRHAQYAEAQRFVIALEQHR